MGVVMTPRDRVEKELLDIARLIEDLKRPCGMDPESPTAIQNGRYMSIAYKVREIAGRLPAREDAAAEICRAVAELPDRNSPEDWPEAMLVTHEELRNIVLDALPLAPAFDIAELIAEERESWGEAGQTDRDAAMVVLDCLERRIEKANGSVKMTLSGFDILRAAEGSELWGALAASAALRDRIAENLARNGTGMRDSGGVTPSGEPIWVGSAATIGG